ncbi:hypothetical protein DSM104443_04287 [Usitatibacter rugosus]|uniref:CHAT domain-containing protein n=1 Tax=Usitatibacter rugosus TaxID=2732067 RepID=A0A6M4H1H9_9PROT|nr:hypothetical protein DSM104443_04287 [Usitatibacter rugosus]
MGGSFIPLASSKALVRIVAIAALATGARAELIAPLAWSRIEATCPAILQAATVAIVSGAPGSESIDIGGLAFERDKEVRTETERLKLQAPAFDSASWTVRIAGERCAAETILGPSRELSTDQAREFAARSAKLQEARTSILEIDRAVSARDATAALAAAKSACDARRTALGNDAPLVAECDILHARRATAASRADLGLALSEIALASLWKAPNTASLAEIFNARQAQARALFFLSRPAEMREAARIAYEGRLRLLGPSHPDTLASQETLAIAHQSMGQVDDAIAIQEVLVRSQVARQGAGGSDALRVKANLSASLQQRGDYERVVALQSEILQARRSTLGDKNPATLVATHDLGIALTEAGRIDEALPLVAGSLPTFLEVLGEDDVQTLRIKTLLGVIYDRLGRSEDSLPLYSDVRARRARLLGAAHAETASAARNQAFALLVLDRPAEALEVIDDAMAQMPAGSNRVESVESGLLVIRAEALLRLGEPARSLESFTKLGGRTFTADEVRSVTRRQLEVGAGWARAQFASGDEALARRSMDVLYQGCRERFGSSHVTTLNFMALLAQMQVNSGNKDEAQELLAQFVEINEGLIRAGVSTSAANRGRLAQGVRDRPDMAGYRTYARLLALRDPERALEIAELARARSLNEILARPHADSAKVRDARLRFAQAEQRVGELDVGSAPYLRAVSDRTRAEEELRQAFDPVMRRASSIDTRAMWKRVLAPGSVFVEFIVSGDQVTAITMNAQARVVAKDLGTIAGLAETVEVFRRLSMSPEPASERIWQLPDGSARWALAQPKGATRLKDLDSVRRTLSARLLEPLAPEIRSARTWIISPDGALAFLPFEALALGRQTVLESKDVVYAPSLASLAIMPARVTTSPRLDFLGVGVSQFRSPGSTWADLPRAEAEIRAIGSLFPASRVLAGVAANEELLRALDASGELRRYRFVHFATHAFLSSRGGSLSGVVLSGSGNGGGDGIVTAAEWATYRLRSDLVVFSACDTGLGSLVAGEGVVGLPSAILAAGARAVVLTLWSVADESAADFMPRFYKRLKAGKSPSEALRETKLEFARSKGPWSSPRHWAPYVLYGAS